MTGSEDPYPGVYLYRRLVRAKLFMDAHFAEPIDLKNIAGGAYYSKFHFIRKFRQIYGATPHRYLTGVRIENARQLLRMGRPVAEVCHRVGFESPGSFSVLFKRHVGMLPSLYLARQRLLASERSSTPLKFVPGCFAERYGWTKKRNFEEVI